jgi:hypothetical protein
MSIEKKIVAAGLPKTNHDSARRAINKILKRSTGKIPRKDLIDLLRIITEAL